MAKLVFDLIARDKATAEVAKVKKSLSDLTTSAGWKNLVTGIGVGAGVAAYNAATGAIRGMGDALVEGVRDAAEEEAGLARLTAALHANVPAWDGNMAAIEAVIAKRREMAFSDDELRQSFGSIVAATHDVSQAFEVQQTAMDLARFKGISLAEASDALVKVEAGQYRMLKSLGIVLGENATQTEALAAVQAVASGQAATFADSAAGSFAKLTDSFSELQESIGKQLLPVVKPLVDALRDVTESGYLLPAMATVAAAAFATMAAALLPLVIEITAASGGLNLMIAALVGAGVVLASTGPVAAKSAKDVRSYADAMYYMRGESERAKEAQKELAARISETAMRVSERDDIKPPEINPNAWNSAAKRAAEQAKKIADAVAAGLADGYDNVKSAMQKLVDAMAEAKPDSERVAELLGLLSSQKVADGLKSGDAYVRAAAQALVAAATDELKALGKSALLLGQQTAKMLGTAFGGPGGNQMYSNAALDAVKQYAAFMDQFGAKQPDWPSATSGTNATASATANLTDKVRTAIGTLTGFGAQVRSLVSTFGSSWTPTVLTSAQASGVLETALGKARSAVGALKVGVESTRAAAVTAFERMRDAALAYFEAVHRERLKALADAHDATLAELTDRNAAQQSALQVQIDAINAGVQAYRDSLDAISTARQKAKLEEALLNAQGQYSNPLDQAVADAQKSLAERQAAEEEARLKANLTNARSRAERTAAQQALDDFYARANLERLTNEQQTAGAIATAQQNLDDFTAQQQLTAMQQEADRQTQALQRQQAHLQSVYDAEVTAANELYAAQVENENLRYEAQTTALKNMFDSLTGSLEDMKEAWNDHSKKVVTLLKTYDSKLTSVARNWITAMQQAIDENPLTVAMPTVVGAGVQVTPHAKGGYIGPGELGLVGEQGPEIVTGGRYGMTVYPTGTGPGGGGGSTVVHTIVNLDGRQIAELVDRHLGYRFATAARTTGAI